MKQLPSQEALRGLFSYDPDTGHLTNLHTRNSRAVKGRRAGNLMGTGYRRVRVDGVEYGEHRLIWKLVHGEDPDVINHKDHNRSNNRLNNLENGTCADNNRHSAAATNTLPLGVKQLKDKGIAYSRYMARATVDGKRLYLGTYETPEQAHNAYLEVIQCQQSSTTRSATLHVLTA